MRSGHLVSLVGAVVLFSVAGCAGVTPKANGDGGGSSGTGSGGSIGYDGGRPDIPTIEVGNIALCGNGVIDPGEACDDMNTMPGDGCSAICQIPAGWTCTGTPNCSIMRRVMTT